jgi:hypothetical protein
MEQTPNPDSEIILYQTEDGRTRLEVKLENETVWLSLNQMAELFQRDKSVISKHIKHIFEEGELPSAATVAKNATVQDEGNRKVSRNIEYYNLDAIISVGYRVKSLRGTQFRIWATQRLREYIIKGFVLDDERLKNPPGPGAADYFDDLLERIRDIRSSERRMYLRVREIFALAADYQPDDAQTLLFFQTVQNKLHYSVSRKTAPEIIVERADAAKPNMGLTTWKGGLVRKGDVTIAKNYLSQAEITELNRIVMMYLEFAEDQARRRKQIFMKDWRQKTDDFLRFNEREVLAGAGAVSHESALEQYDVFAGRRRHALEAQAEAKLMDGIKELEAKAKRLAAPKKKK